jgi:hypothetical protein
VVAVLEAEAEEDEPGDHEGGGEPDDGEAGFGFEDAVVAAHGDAGCEVVEPVSGELAEESGDDGGEVEEAFDINSQNMIWLSWMGREGKKGARTNLLKSEVIKWGQKNRECRVNSHHPGKRKAIIDTTQQHSRLRNHLPWSDECFPERASLLPALPLLDAYQSQPARFGHRLLGGWDVSVVEGFIDEKGYTDEADGCHDGEEPETPVPLRGVEDEGCEEGPEVGREDDKPGPDIDFAAGIELAMFLW